MPEYSFECEKCEVAFTSVFSIAEYDEKIKKVKCPECKSKRVLRDYGADRIVPNYVKGLHEATTLGEYADKQTAKLSRDERDAKLRSYKTKKNPNTGIKELPSGMSRAKTNSDMPRISKQDAKKKRKGK